MKNLLIGIGALLIAFGLLFLLQGAGIVHWPPESFMLDQRPWVYKGAGMMLIGLAAIAAARWI